MTAKTTRPEHLVCSRSEHTSNLQSLRWYLKDFLVGFTKSDMGTTIEQTVFLVQLFTCIHCTCLPLMCMDKITPFIFHLVDEYAHL